MYLCVCMCVLVCACVYVRVCARVCVYVCVRVCVNRTPLWAHIPYTHTRCSPHPYTHTHCNPHPIHTHTQQPISRILPTLPQNTSTSLASTDSLSHFLCLILLCLSLSLFPSLFFSLLLSYHRARSLSRAHAFFHTLFISPSPSPFLTCSLALFHFLSLSLWPSHLFSHWIYTRADPFFERRNITQCLWNCVEQDRTWVKREINVKSKET